MIRPAVRVFEALIVHGESFEQVFLEHCGRPAAELDTTRGADAVTDGEDRIEVVESERAANLPLTLDLNYRGFLGSCLPAQFFFLVDIFKMQTDIVLADCEKLRDFPLGQPDSVVFRAELDAAPPVFRGV